MHTLVANLLWSDFCPMQMAGLLAGRRVAVARGTTGQIVVFSPLPVSDSAVAQLREIGEPAAFVIPSRFHEKFFSDYFVHFPRSVFLASQASLADHPRWKLKDFSLSSPELTGFEMVRVDGMPAVQEHVFYQSATRTLIIADLLFNIPQSGSWFTRTLLKIADMGGKPRPSRLWRTIVRTIANSEIPFSESESSILTGLFQAMARSLQAMQSKSSTTLFRVGSKQGRHVA